MNRRAFLKLAAALSTASLAPVGPLSPPLGRAQTPPAAQEGATGEQYTLPKPRLDDKTFKKMVEALVDTGVKREGIPAVDRPEFISIASADLVMEDEDIVFLLDAADGPRIYPRAVLVWHEIVNDLIADERVTITHSPLTGALVGYRGNIEAFTTTFGNEGKLLYNNTVLYDRATATIWPQLLGVGINGPLKGKRLTAFPLLWTTYERAKLRSPNARVLSRATGRRRPYNRDPYGDYKSQSSYYQNRVILHPIPRLDDRLHPKEPVLGMLPGGFPLALPKNQMRTLGVLNFDYGEFELVAFYDPLLDATRVFNRNTFDERLKFRVDAGKIVADPDKGEYSPEGLCLTGKHNGKRLSTVNAFDCMWFAWTAFNPGGDVVTP